jgi:hypothetical protein
MGTHFSQKPAATSDNRLMALRAYRTQRFPHFLHFSAFSDHTGQFRAIIRPCCHSFQLPHGQHAISQHLAKDYMLAIQPICFTTRNKELTPIRIWTGIGHRQKPRACVAGCEVFVLKSRAVNGKHASTITSYEIASLQHKSLDYLNVVFGIEREIMKSGNNLQTSKKRFLPCRGTETLQR